MTAARRRGAIRVFAGLCALVAAFAARADGRICTSADVLLFGNQPLTASATQTATVSNCGDQPWSFTGVSVHPATAPAFHVLSGCATGQTLAPGQSCVISVTFNPFATGQVSGGVWLHNTTSTPDQLLTFYGRGVTGQAGSSTIQFLPASASFGPQVVGTQSPPLTIELSNLGPSTLVPSALVLNGPAAYDYSTQGSCAVGSPVPAGKSCTLAFFFLPLAAGLRSANLVIDAPQLAALAIIDVEGVATSASLPAVDVVEFFHPPTNHYFLTASTAEEAAIDAGRVGVGWTRTGESFHAWADAASAPAGALPVCRFFGTPGVGPASHFFTANPAECAAVKTNPGWIYEGTAFYALLPAGGTCAEASVAVIRFFWAGAAVADSRHRYVQDAAVLGQMRAAGWLEEGPVFCSPP
jgi:Repeat of unknown function (DUF5648)/Abnormal spindle-like microcephaly-assoc'd, ASPM-SPD-2-Hydin